MKKLFFICMFGAIVCLFSVPFKHIFALENTRIQPAKVYFIHPPDTHSISLFNDYQFLTMLKSNSYFLADFSPGLNTIRYSDGKKVELLNVFEFVPGQTYYIDIGDYGYHSLLNEVEGVQLLKKVQIQASYTEKAEKHASELLKKYNFQNDAAQLKNLARIPVNNVGEDDSTYIKIPRFTPIKLKFTSELSSVNLKKGDLIEFQVSENVIIDNNVVIPQGTMVKGHLLKVFPPQKYGSQSFIDIITPNINLNEGTSVPIIGRYIRSGVSKEGTARKIKGVGYAAIILGPATDFSTIFLEALLCDWIASGIKGQKITISKETEFTVWTRDDTYEGSGPYSSLSKDGVGNRLKTQLPSEMIFPDIQAPVLVDSLKAYDILLNEINNYKMGKSISTQLFFSLNATLYQRADLNHSTALICAKEANGYYLKVDLKVGPNQIDKGSFELYDPNSDTIICKVEVREAFGSSYNDATKKLLQKGVKKLSEKLKAVKPSLVK